MTIDSFVYTIKAPHREFSLAELCFVCLEFHNGAVLGGGNKRRVSCEPACFDVRLMRNIVLFTLCKLLVGYSDIYLCGRNVNVNDVALFYKADFTACGCFGSNVAYRSTPLKLR